jgi:Y4BN protein
MSERNLPHIVVSNSPIQSGYKPPKGGGSDLAPISDRFGHGKRLQQEYQNAWAKDDEERGGAYIVFKAFPGLKEIFIGELDSTKDDYPELLSIKTNYDADGKLIQQATIYIPIGQKQLFLNKLNAYLKSIDNDRPDNRKLVENIESIFRATLCDLWTDDNKYFPEDLQEKRWWEVWLWRKRGHSDENLQDRVKQNAKKYNVQIGKWYLGIGDRAIVHLKASCDELSRIFDSIDAIAELRLPRTPDLLDLLEMPGKEQREWVDDLRTRLKCADSEAPVVCILDYGVQSTHPLLEGSLAEQDKHVADPLWNHDPVRERHGTEMAGLALFGDLERAIHSKDEITLWHRLESVKILPDQEQNDPDLYGAITAKGVDQVEIAEHGKKRAFMMAVTVQQGTEVGEHGKPTSWSAIIDALAFGRAVISTRPNFINLDREELATARLFILSAGNIRENLSGCPKADYCVRNDEEPIEDPAQSWNAITVGAYSRHKDMKDADHEGFKDWTPVAEPGEISPASRTSVKFDGRKWPFKPEVVADGGNYAQPLSGGELDTPESLAILTTAHQSANNLGLNFFTTTRDTSAATAQVAAIAADIWFAYPDFRPETVRALIVHSAEWTPAMREHFNPKKSKAELKQRLRRYGMGVPSLQRALYSAKNAVTLIAESRIHPFIHKGNANKGSFKEMHFYELPWPKEALEELGETSIKMRITLSYFIEPNPSNRGWRGKYSYNSYGFRFAVKRPEESVEEFQQRISRIHDDENKKTRSEEGTGWLFGRKQHKSAGSLHTDIWEGTAAELAAKGVIAIYPVLGWWRDQVKFDQSDRGVHYSLIVSIEAPEVDVDLWTPINVANKVTVEVEQ